MDGQALHEAARKGQVRSVQTLLAAGCCVDLPAPQTENTALHLACRGGHAEIAKILIKRRADANAVNEQGQNPMGLAFKASQRGGQARSSFRALREVLVAAG